jgi:predicted nucleic acid-binding protein
MARGTREIVQGTVVLDSQGLSLLLQEDARMVKRVEKARSENFHVVISAMTILESDPAGPARRRRDSVLSRLRIEAVTREVALGAADLLRRTGMGGHTHAIDSVVAATALRQVRPAILYTSDPGDLIALCSGPERSKDERVAIVRV